MITFHLKHGETAFLSEADTDLVSWGWRRGTHGYASRYRLGTGRNGKRKTLLLHEVVLERAHGPRPIDMQADHINRIKLDNRRENLRWCTPGQNSLNMWRRSNSGYKGVYRLKRYPNKFTAQTGRKYIGTFNSAEDAAHAYDRIAKEILGPYAPLNFPEDSRA